MNTVTPLAHAAGTKTVLMFGGGGADVAAISILFFFFFLSFILFDFLIMLKIVLHQKPTT